MTDIKKYPKATEVRKTATGVPYLIKFESNQAAEAMYNEANRDLIITYTNGSRYVYKDFPFMLWLQFLRSVSKGSFISRFIKGKYEYQRIGPEETNS
jgi:KTSC domain